jgi:hypothetical protein
LTPAFAKAYRINIKSFPESSTSSMQSPSFNDRNVVAFVNRVKPAEEGSLCGNPSAEESPAAGS